MINALRVAIAGGFLAGMLGISGQAFADLPPGGVVVDFENSDVAGFDPIPAAVFPSFGQSYIEDGVEHSGIGFGTVPGASIGVTSGGSSHVHGATVGGSRVSELEADAGGGLFRLADLDPFSVDGLDVVSLNLSHSDGTSSDLVFRGYDSADFSSFFEVTLDETVAGTHVDLFDLNNAFGNIYLLEYWFSGPGRGNDPATNPVFADLALQLDNVEFGPVSAIPIPAAVYLFGTGLIGLVSFGRRRFMASNA